MLNEQKQTVFKSTHPDIRGAPDLDPDPAGYPVKFWDPVWIWIRPDPIFWDPVWIRIRPDPAPDPADPIIPASDIINYYPNICHTITMKYFFLNNSQTTINQNSKLLRVCVKINSKLQS